MEQPGGKDKIPKKKQQLIDSARELFCRHGIRRVTVEEICRNAGVSKMTCYKYFKNKWDLGRAVLDQLFSEGLGHYDAMIHEQIPFHQKVENILRLTMIQVHAFGSVLLDELMDESCPLHGSFMEKQKTVSRLSIEFFSRAQLEGHIHAEVEMPVLMFMLDQLSNLLNHPDFIKILPDVEDRACEIAAIFFHGFARNPSQEQAMVNS